MKADPIYFKGYSCFKNEWVGFDTIKPINVIIGRNNSGKSHLLDLVEVLCEDKPFHHEWKYRCVGVLDEESLNNVLPVREKNTVISLENDPWLQHSVGKNVIWEVTSRRSSAP